MRKEPTFTFPKISISSSSQPEFLPKSRAFIFAATIIFLTLILSNRFILKPALEIAKTSDRNIYAPEDFRYKDENATNKLINNVISTIKPSFKKDKTITAKELSDLKEFLQEITDIKEATKETPFFNKGIISTDIQNYILSLDQDKWEKAIYYPTIETLTQLLAGGVPEKLNKTTLQEALENFIPPGVNSVEEKAIGQIIVASVFPNEDIYYGSKTEDSANEAAKKKEITSLYKKYLYTGINNSRWLKTTVIKLNNDKTITTIDLTAYIFNELESLRRIKRLNKLVYNTLPPELQEPLHKLPSEQWWAVKEIINNSFKQLLNEGISRVDLSNMQTNLEKYIPDNLSNNEKRIIFLVVNKIARPNVIIDQQEFEKLQKEAVKQVKPVFVNVKKSTLLLKKGQLITKERMKILEAAGVLDKKINWGGIYEVFSVIAMIIFAFTIYLFAFEKEVFHSSTNLWLISIMLTATIGISNLLVDNEPRFIPMAVFIAIIAMFINQRVALVCLLLVAVIFYKSYDIGIITLATLAIGSMAALITFHKVNQRINIIKGGIIIALVQIIFYNLINIAPDISLSESQSDIFIESTLWFISGLAFSMMILAILPIVEEFFGLITYSRLTELGDFNQPLLRELEDKTPGTFQHSIAVSTLTEYAARKLNLDSTLCRVGAYYHDIGKMFKPEYFVENQLGDDNPHDRLNDPYKSAKIIISHARAGVALARKHKLPPALIPFMIEHHGTSLVNFFYFKAKQQAQNNEDIDEMFFRYYGPRPQSKETALIMLADSSEAAVRALKEKNTLSVKNKLKEIFAEKINDGQLSESGLTTDEIAVIIDIFTFVVLEIHHKRIEYPSLKTGASFSGKK